jgi:hypothetical protein
LFINYERSDEYKKKNLIFMEPSMQIFLYSSEIDGNGKKIQRMMEDDFHTDQLEVLRSIENLSRKLQEPWKEKPIVVILAYKKDELLDLVSIRDQLHPVRLILVLPDTEKGTISLAHRLRPNYLTYMHRNLMELKAVLQRMLTRSRESKG